MSSKLRFDLCISSSCTWMRDQTRATPGRTPGRPATCNIPYNHFAAINFMESNERMVEMATALIARLQEQVRTTGRWTPAESQFAKNWMIAWKMLARLRDLNTHARIWSEMRQEYSEWADPRER